MSDGAIWNPAASWVQRKVATGALPCAVLGIASADRVEHLEAFGAGVDDFFALFSITKPIVAMAALREVEGGRLSLETDLREAIPEFGDAHRGPVLLRHLLSHTSGILDPELHAPKGLRRSLLEAPSLFRSGTMSRYSSISFEGIAALIELSSGRPWQSVVAELTDSVGISGLTFSPECAPRPVFGTESAGIDYSALTRLMHPGAGIHGRAEDLLALGQSLLRNDGRALAPVTLAAMLTPQTVGLPRLEPNPAEAGQDWGLGFNLRTAAPALIDHDVFGHSGWSGCEFWIYPSAGICFVLLTNTAPPPFWYEDADNLHNSIVAAAAKM